MLKSCKYCGRIHDSKYNCGKKPQYKRNKDQDKFRSTHEWQEKREQIKQRDLYLCRMCLSQNQLTYNDLSVHHIEPLIESWEKRLDDDNLITLCTRHHEQAEDNQIPRELLKRLAKDIPPTLTR